MVTLHYPRSFSSRQLSPPSRKLWAEYASWAMISFRSLAARSCWLSLMAVSFWSHPLTTEETNLGSIWAIYQFKFILGKGKNAFNAWAVKQPWRSVLPLSFFQTLSWTLESETTKHYPLQVCWHSMVHGCMYTSQVWCSSAMASDCVLNSFFCWDDVLDKKSKLPCLKISQLRRSWMSKWNTWGQAALFVRAACFHMTLCTRCTTSQESFITSGLVSLEMWRNIGHTIRIWHQLWASNHQSLVNL